MIRGDFVISSISHLFFYLDLLIMKARTISDKSTFVEDLASGIIPTKLYGMYINHLSYPCVVTVSNILEITISTS
jgi:hypothetical protein